MTLRQLFVDGQSPCQTTREQRNSKIVSTKPLPPGESRVPTLDNVAQTSGCRVNHLGKQNNHRRKGCLSSLDSTISFQRKGKTPISRDPREDTRGQFHFPSPPRSRKSPATAAAASAAARPWTQRDRRSERSSRSLGPWGPNFRSSLFFFFFNFMYILLPGSLLIKEVVVAASCSDIPGFGLGVPLLGFGVTTSGCDRSNGVPDLRAVAPFL